MSTAILLSALGAKGSWVAEVYWRTNPRCSSAQFFWIVSSNLGTDTQPRYLAEKLMYGNTFVRTRRKGRSGNCGLLENKHRVFFGFVIFFKVGANGGSDTLPHYITEKLIKNVERQNFYQHKDKREAG